MMKLTMGLATRSVTMLLLAFLFGNLVEGGDISLGSSSHLERVENGLLPAAIIKDEPAVRMGLTERMRHYKVPGVSFAIINNYEIEWAKGYGILEAGTEKPVTTGTVF